MYKDEVNNKPLTSSRLEELKEMAKNSTNVVGWYAHSSEVRGPFCRWFTCSEVSPEYRKHVAYTGDDCKFAAAAMNHFLPLIEEVETLRAEIRRLMERPVK